MTDDDRTNAIGLFNYAHSYWQSARTLKRAKVKATHPDAPTYYLFCHAIELYLKSYLCAHGTSVKDLRDKYRHNITRLADGARFAKLHFDDEDNLVISLIDQMDILTLRYIRTGASTRPTLEALNRSCKSFHGSVGRDLRKRGIVVRGVPKRRRPRNIAQA